MNTFGPGERPSGVLKRPPSSGKAVGTQKPSTLASPYGTLGIARATSPAFEVGQQARQGFNSAIDMAKKAGGAVVNTVTLPTRVGMAVAGDAASGFLGRPLSAPAQQAAAVARPRPAAVAPAAMPVKPSAPAAGTALPVGPYAGGRADPSAAAGQAFTNSQGKPAVSPPGVAVSQDANGRPVFTASGESVAQTGGGPAAPAPVEDAPAMPSIARPQYVDPAPGAVIANPGSSDEAQRRLEIALSGVTFESARSRGARDAQATMVQGLFAHAGRNAEIAGANQRAQLDATTRTDLTRMGQQGEDYRADVGQASETYRTRLEDAGDTLRDREAQAAQTERARLDLLRPRYVTDADGNYVALSGTGASPISVDGKPLRAPPTKEDGSITPALALDSLTKQLEAEAGSLQPNHDRMAALQQQINDLIAGNSGSTAPSSGTATNPKTGGRVRLDPSTGRWLPIEKPGTSGLPEIQRPGAPQS